MNTNPDEATLALWLDDELTGPELAGVESWAAAHPEQLAARDGIRRWRHSISAAIPASVEPPYPDFFNSRVLQAIRESSIPAKPAVKQPSAWRAWLMPATACAGMALAFWVGSRSVVKPESVVIDAPRPTAVEPVVYTPENGVDAEWFASSRASATVIVLNGVAAIPDDTDFSETVINPSIREIDSTAALETLE